MHTTVHVSEFYIYAFQIISECSTNDIYNLLNDGITLVGMNKSIQRAEAAGQFSSVHGNHIMISHIITIMMVRETLL